MPGLTIGELATASGVAQATLRAWERRHGFPVPQRQAGGHRRYDAGDVRRVVEVARLRDTGLALEAAIREVLATDRRHSASVYAGIRQGPPPLVPTVLSKTTLIALSRAIEDECCARAVRPTLFGAFQLERYLTGSRDRWRELARTAEVAVVFAQADGGSRVPRPGDPVMVDIPPDAPLRREWVVVCDSTDHPACLAAWELPGQDAVADGERLFESVWSLDPVVVRRAAAVCHAMARELQPGLELPPLPATQPAPASADLLRATSLFDRMCGYVDARLVRR